MVLWASPNEPGNTTQSCLYFHWQLRPQRRKEKQVVSVQWASQVPLSSALSLFWLLADWSPAVPCVTGSLMKSTLGAGAIPWGHPAARGPGTGLGVQRAVE